MKHKVELPSPADITVGDFIAFSTARTDVARFSIITGQPREEVAKIPRSVVTLVIDQYKEVVSMIQDNPDFPRIITFDGVEYGFEPNLQRISTGAWADISHLEENGKQLENLNSILAVLYRRVTDKWGVKDVKYRIEDYNEFNGDAIDNADLFLDFKLSDAFGVLSFFLSLQKDCMSSLEMMMMRELKKATGEMREEICHI